MRVISPLRPDDFESPINALTGKRLEQSDRSMTVLVVPGTQSKIEPSESFTVNFSCARLGIEAEGDVK